MKKLVIMNFSGIYDLEQFAANPAAVHIDCTHLMGTDCCGECTTTIHQLTSDPAIQLDNKANAELLALLDRLT